jgi:uncharacterized repeat protein (TIGR03803 family)
MTAILKTLIAFDNTDGSTPQGNLIADSDGDLFGTTEGGGANGEGTVFEIAKTAAGYAGAPTILVSFDDASGGGPLGGLLADTSGDLFGTISSGTTSDGAVFEIVKTATGYATTPTMLASFDGGDGSIPEGSLIADANGDLFGTTKFGGGASGQGVVFEIAKTPDGYASTPTTLAAFTGPDGLNPGDDLIADANGDLFGTAFSGGSDNMGTVFEIAKTADGYADTPTILVSFTATPGASFSTGLPVGGLIADSDGDLFGVAQGGGAGNDGVVFEIVKTASGYASTATTLAQFNGANGRTPGAALLADANGDLFGTTFAGGSDNSGTIFEIKKTATGYAQTPTVLASFNGTDGSETEASLIADAEGDLFGTSPSGGPNGGDFGTVFEVANTTVTADILWQNTTTGQASIWEMDQSTLVGGGAVTPNPGPSFKEIGSGDFNKDGSSDILWQNTSTGQASIGEMNGTTLIGGGPVTPNPGPDWRAIGSGDFTDDGFADDILWQNTVTGQASIWEMNGATLEGGGPVTPNPGLAWKAVGTGDFNQDGSSDILWQNQETGAISIWEMHGNTLIGGGQVTPNPGTAWQAIGTGDFNKDGFADILLQKKDTGAVSVWEMNGNTLIGGGQVANPGLSWHAIGTGAGGSDILLQNTSGQATIWEMNGNSIAGGGPVSPNPGPSFRAVGLT